MSENIGILMKKESNGFAQVVLDRKSGCGGCRTTGSGCHTCLASANKMQVRVTNAIGANVGDLVKVQLSFGVLSAGAAILYLLPVAGMLCGAFVGGFWLTGWLHIAEMTGSILGAVCGLALGFAAVISVDRSPGFRARITPDIKEVVRPGISGLTPKDTYCRSC
jgi:sigma-E factor negative regulatory protein RseC